MPVRIGVDEAGRGPVLGSMFVGGVAVRDNARLPDGIEDSKRLSPDRRERLVDLLEGSVGVRIAVIEVPTDQIDADDANLNAVTARAQADVITRLLPDDADGVRCTVDACDVDAERFGETVSRRLPDGVHVDARHRADADVPLVSAASIVAKSRREAHVDALAARFGEIGSGYPSDPTTRRFLVTHVEEHGDLPPCARRSWGTCADVLAAAQQGTLAEFANR